MIKQHKKLDHPPPKGNRNDIYSSADKIKKREESRLNVYQLVRKPKLKTSKEAPIVCSRDGQLKSNKEKVKGGCSKKEQSKNITCIRIIENKNCQAEKSEKSVNMWPKKFQMDVWSEKPAKQSSFKKKHISLYNDKNCKDTISCKTQKKCEYDDSKRQSTVKYMCYDKNYQEIKRPKKPKSVMWSVTKEMDMWLAKPASRRLCSDKSCQSTRCSSLKKKSPVRPMNKYDKNCQSM